MSFIDNGSASRLRAIYLSLDDHCAWCVYSSLKGCIIIKEFYVDKNVVESYYGRLYKYYFHNDQQLLKMTSTSPAQERATFVINTKTIFCIF